jgi:ATP-dependent Zn protease
MTIKERRRTATAYHEAGRAVVAFYLNVNFRTVTIVPSDGKSAHIVMSRPADSAWQENRVIVNFSGWIAEQKFHGCKVRYGYHSDDLNAADLSVRFDGIDRIVRSNWFRWLHAQSEEMVEARWRDIETVAKALLQEKTLSFERVGEILNAFHTPVRTSAI